MVGSVIRGHWQIDLRASGRRAAEDRVRVDESFTTSQRSHFPSGTAFTMNTSMPAPGATPDADFFRALEVERTQAHVARDMPAIQRLHAPDYELISPPGRVMTRERYLSLIAAEPFYAKWSTASCECFFPRAWPP
ncbi:MAG: nuclear transport factor 2 family protein [Burkholderiaceae bacterium]